MSFAATTTYEVVDCPRCGQLFAITEEYVARRRDDGKTFYCPSGHSMSYTDTTQRQLQRERDRSARLAAQLDQARAERDATERRRRATKGQLTRVKNRVANGVCPCCNRSFSDLARHMESQHPDYATADHATA